MLRCKEGDLAVVLKGPYAGYFVTVGEFLGNIRASSTTGGPVYSVDCWEIKNPEIAADFPGKEINCVDACLQPIRPGRTPTTTETEKEVMA